MKSNTTRGGTRPRGVLIGLCLSIAAMACSAKDDEKNSAEAAAAEEEACQSTRAFFARQVWAPVMGDICVDCHSPGGIAIENGAQFQLMPAGYPGFLDHNLEAIRNTARIEVEGTSQILLKPLGRMNHGGGQVLEEEGDGYQALSQLLEQLSATESCAASTVGTELPDVELLGPVATLRKASLHLVGRLPTPEETDRISSGGEDALGGAIMDLMREEAFFTRLKEIYNDLLLVDRYTGYNGYALNILNDEDFPSAGGYYDTLDDDLKRQVTRSVAHEPLELIAHVVRNDRPFTEILTADYIVMNGDTAPVYNVSAPGSDYGGEYREERIVTARGIRWPHAGVLTSPMFLNRFPTTDTNRNRHRARMIFDLFLATDILQIAERPIDPTESARYINPTRDDPSCNHCHRQIDPVAGAFLRFDDNDQEELRPDREWFPEMFPPGFGDEVMEVADFDNAPGWLAARIVEDPRFRLAVVHTMFEALIGHPPLPYPTDASVMGYDTLLSAWKRQEATFRAIGQTFVESDYNLKVVIRDIILSPYFRAAHAADGADDVASKLSHVGTGRLSIPEVLSRKIEAVTGIRWARGWDRSAWLDSDYDILYGGIDSDTITDRLTVPNGIMAAVGWRMANEVACAATAWDFMQPAGERHLFRHVEPSDTPASSASAIRDNIRYLHAHVLGEDLEEDDPEVDRTYRLFEDTWKEGKAKVESEELGKRIQWRCQGRENPLTGEEIPEDERLRDDESYAIRSWMAVITYLLADYRFLYE